MQKRHPFLTSVEDSAFYGSLSEMEEESLIAECENCYQILKPEFFSANAVWSLSQVLALFGGTTEEKCAKTMELFDGLKEVGCRYGTGVSLPGPWEFGYRPSTQNYQRNEGNG